MRDNEAQAVENRLRTGLQNPSGDLINIAFGTELYEALVRLKLIQMREFGNPAFPSQPLLLPAYGPYPAILNKRIAPYAYSVGEGGYDAQGT